MLNSFSFLFFLLFFRCIFFFAIKGGRVCFYCFFSFDVDNKEKGGGVSFFFRSHMFDDDSNKERERGGVFFCCFFSFV